MSLTRERREIIFRLQRILNDKVERGELEFNVSTTDKVALIAYECLTKNGYEVEMLPGQIRIRVPQKLIKTRVIKPDNSIPEGVIPAVCLVLGLCFGCYWVVSNLLAW